MTFSLFATIAAIVFAIAVVNTCTFNREQSQAMKYWSFAWTVYCFGLLLLVIYHATSEAPFLILREVFDTANLLFILFGSYALVHVKSPSYWYRFFLYIILLGGICMIYNLQLLSYCLPVSVFQIIIVVFACYNVYSKWNISQTIKVCSVLVLLAWGLFKSTISIINLFTDANAVFTTMIELMFCNVLNITIFIITIINMANEKEFAQDLYKNVIEKSNDTIFYYQFKPYAAFKYITDSVKAMTDYSAEAFYSNPDLFSHIVAPDNLSNINEIFNDKNTNDGTYIIKMLNRQSEEYWAEFYRRTETDEKGNVTAIICNIRDVTDMQTAQMEQIQATKSRNMLLSYISHELRTPMTSIAGYMTAINDGVMSGEDEVREAFEIITSKTITLKTLIDDLDQLTKLETNQFTFDYMLTNVEELVNQLITSNYVDATSGHNFEVNIETDMSTLSKYWVIIDVVRINQVFTNLVTNAYKYARDNKRMDWSFKIDPSEENLIVYVKDYGKGIKSKHLPHIFDKFYRADYADTSQRQIEGRGLGLTLCREMINAHHGEIFAESVYGEGSKFTFIIPLYKED